VSDLGGGPFARFPNLRSTLLGVVGDDDIDPEQQGDIRERLDGGVRGLSNMSWLPRMWSESDEAGDSKAHVAPEDEYPTHAPPYEPSSVVDWLANIISDVESLLQWDFKSSD
jgi:hypothetical protein